jgi:hypothetical protein
MGLWTRLLRLGICFLRCLRQQNKRTGPVATYSKFYQFAKDLIDGVHDFDAHVFKIFLTNTAPAATNTVRADLTAAEPANGNGYTTGGNGTSMTTSISTGTAKVTGTDPATWTAAGGTIGPFQYAVLYNDTPSSPADPLIAWWVTGPR